MVRLMLLLASLLCVSAQHDDRIVGGKPTTIESFPHQISLRYMDSHICGGSIINELLIITAAHCVHKKNEEKFSALVGVTHRKDELSGKIYYANVVYSYPTFTMDTLDCDVAFVRLQTPIVFGPKAKPITIAPVSDQPKHGDILTATGWGRTEPDGSSLSNILRKADLPVIDLKLCRLAYKDYKPLVTENMFCAGGSVNNQATYRGDSGGPIINTKGQLVGLTSWGKAMDPLGYPKIFTNLSSPKVRSFVDKIRNEKFV